MRHSRVAAQSFEAILSPLAILGPLVGVVASLAGALPALAGDVPFTEHVISTMADGASSVFAIDLDGDGDIDIVSASALDNTIAWYESDGGSPPIFAKAVIPTTGNYPNSVFALDVDGDDHIDVLACFGFNDTIAWYKNNDDSPLTFTEHVITQDPDGPDDPKQGFANGPVSVFATDLNGDGNIDVLSASVNDNKIAWYESNGDSPPIFTLHVIPTTTASGAFSVFAIDLDGDLEVDILSAAMTHNSIVWYESNGGSPPTFTEHIISTTAFNARSVFATYLDGDGDIDILSASLDDDKIRWYENGGGSRPTFTEHVISATADGARSVFAVDVNGDGNTDVLSASENDNKIAWYESDGDSPPTFTERVISTTALGAGSVFAVDVDGDGDIDVISASFNDDKIAWYENTTPNCGNGVVEVGEECDPPDGQCCSDTCTFEAGGTTCDDGDDCTGPDACAAGACGGVAFSCLYGDITSATLCAANCTGVGTDVDFDDVLCALNGFALAADCPCADIAGAVETPCIPDGEINFDDILAVLNAFAGDSTCPDPCP